MAQGKLTLTPTATTKLSLGYLRGWADGTKNGDFTGTFVRSQVEASRRFDDVQMFAPGVAKQSADHRSPIFYPELVAHLVAQNLLQSHGALWQNELGSHMAKNHKPVGVPAAAVYPDGRVEEITESGAASAQAAGAV